MKKTIVYLAGPMTGYPEHNHPAFNAWAKVLRAEGFKVINPAELDAGMDPFPEGHTHLYYRRDLPYLAQADMVALLRGWKRSNGAILEAAVMRALQGPVMALVGRPLNGKWRLKPLKDKDLPKIRPPGT